MLSSCKFIPGLKLELNFKPQMLSASHYLNNRNMKHSNESAVTLLLFLSVKCVSSNMVIMSFGLVLKVKPKVALQILLFRLVKI